MEFIYPNEEMQKVLEDFRMLNRNPVQIEINDFDAFRSSDFFTGVNQNEKHSAQAADSIHENQKDNITMSLYSTVDKNKINGLKNNQNEDGFNHATTDVTGDHFRLMDKSFIHPAIKQEFNGSENEFVKAYDDVEDCDYSRGIFTQKQNHQEELIMDTPGNVDSLSFRFKQEPKNDGEFYYQDDSDLLVKDEPVEHYERQQYQKPFHQHFDQRQLQN